MGHLIADATLTERLRGLRAPVEIRDTSGNLLGTFTPVLTAEEAALYERDRQLFDLEEAERLAALEQPIYTLQEVMEHLRSLDTGK